MDTYNGNLYRVQGVRTRGENVLGVVLSSQNVLVDNVRIDQPLGKSDHNQIHFNIKEKS